MANFCRDCGTPLNESSKFCPGCGRDVLQIQGSSAQGAQSASATPRAATYQCPNCRGVLAFDAATGRLTCAHCGGSFQEGEVERELPIDAAPVAAGATEHVTTVEEFLERAPWQEVAADSMNAMGYSCPSCGAQVVADQSTVSTSCPYCGNTMLVSGIASAGNVPRYVLPFEVTKDQAEARMREHFQHKWYLSRKFDASLEHMQGVYVPYHLYDFDVRGRADYIGYYETPTDDDGNSTRYYYGVKRAGYASFEKVPVDGSSKMPDAHMDAIAPFDFEKMRDFSAAYVAGYLTEVADEDTRACYPRAEERARNSFEDGLRADAVREKGVEGISRMVDHETVVDLKNAASCVLPVWLAHCTWNDVQMLFAVNGETGRCVGDLPIDKTRRMLTVIGVALAVIIIGVAAALILEVDSEDLVEFIGGAIFFSILASLLADSRFKKQMHTAVEASNADMSFTAEGLVVTDRWRSRKRYLRESKALQTLQEEAPPIGLPTR